MRQFNNCDRYLVISQLTPIETQPTEDKAKHAVEVLLKQKPDGSYSYIDNPRFGKPYDGRSNDQIDCSWCDKPAVKWLMHQQFCEKCAKDFTDVHKGFAKI